MSQVRAVAFTGGASVPSARFRVRQYIPALERLGVSLVEARCRFGKYPPAVRLARPFWAAAALTENAWEIASSRDCDVVVLQRELISKLFTLERCIRSPVVLDVDDAIYLFRDGYVARQLARVATAVICGNAEIAAHFSRWSTAIHVIPTGVDTEKYTPCPRSERSGATIGWIGTSANLHELVAIEPALVRAFERIPCARLVVICDRKPNFCSLDPHRVEYRPWSATTEVADIQGMDIGIMPLRDSLWARGKCSFKMLQYMACGLPVIVSPVGMNAQVARLGNCALEASNADEWTDALVCLCSDVDLGQVMGRVGRELVERHFSVAALAPRIAEVIRSVAKHI